MASGCKFKNKDMERVYNKPQYKYPEMEEAVKDLISFLTSLAESKIREKESYPKIHNMVQIFNKFIEKCDIIHNVLQKSIDHSKCIENKSFGCDEKSIAFKLKSFFKRSNQKKLRKIDVNDKDILKLNEIVELSPLIGSIHNTSYEFDALGYRIGELYAQFISQEIGKSKKLRRK
jgi:hypothetical protein